MNQEHACVVVDGAAVVSAGSNCDQLVSAELVDRVQRVLVAPYDHADLILFQELVHNVWSVCHYVILLLGVPCVVSLHALNVIRGCGVTPHDVHAHLLNCVRDATKGHSERSLNFVDVFQLDN